MPGFDHTDTAVKVRDLIKKAAGQQITASVPKPLVGRMMTVDIRRKQGTVWFPGDDQPILVSLIDNAIPGDWHYHVQNDLTELEDLSTIGYGSTVVCQRLNGILYVVQVLTGGLLGVDLNSLGFHILKQRAFNVSTVGNAFVDEIAGSHESFFNFEVQATPVPRNDCVEFGPFLSKSSEFQPGRVEMTVKQGLVSKYYDFTLDPDVELPEISGVGVIGSIQDGMWLRIIPEKTAHGLQINQDFDLDVSIRTSANRANKQVWFRIVNRSADATSVDADITLRSTVIDRARDNVGAELLYYRVVQSPYQSQGALGFTSSMHGFTGANNRKENFSVDATAGFGSHSGFQFVPSSASFSATGGEAKIAIAANNTYYLAYQGAGIGNDMFIYTRLSIPATALTQQVRAGVARYYNVSGASMNSELLFRTDGKIYLAVRQIVGGVATLIGSEVDSLLTYSANLKINMRLRIRYDTSTGNYTHSIKVWYDDQPEPLSSQHSATTTYPWGTGGDVGIFAFATTGNTNTKPFTVSFDYLNWSGEGFWADGVSGSGVPQSYEWHTGPFRSGPLRLANDLQKLWTHTGTFSWDGTNLKFTGQIYFTGIGPHRDGLRSGLALLEYPAAGSFFYVQTMPANADAESIDGMRQVFVNTGIPLYPGESLWVGIPPGVGMENLLPFLFIVKPYEADTLNNEPYMQYQLPEWAVMIAARGPGNSVPQLRLGNGTVLDSWRAPTFSGSWANFAADWTSAGYRMEEGGIVRLKGLIANSGGTGITGTIFTLPTGFRPQKSTMSFQASGSTFGTPGGSRIDIANTGVVSVNAHGANGGSLYLSLDNFTFQTDSV